MERERDTGSSRPEREGTLADQFHKHTTQIRQTSQTITHVHTHTHPSLCIFINSNHLAENLPIILPDIYVLDKHLSE